MKGGLAGKKVKREEPERLISPSSSMNGKWIPQDRLLKFLHRMEERNTARGIPDDVK